MKEEIVKCVRKCILSRADPTKWSETLKKFVGDSGRIVWVCWPFCGVGNIVLRKMHYYKILKIYSTISRKKVILLSCQNRRQYCEIFFGRLPLLSSFLFDVSRTAISSNITTPKGAMLTTHSMEEADALCNRVGIVVKGELK